VSSMTSTKVLLPGAARPSGRAVLFAEAQDIARRRNPAGWR
jgi:hypothetical protein